MLNYLIHFVDVLQGRLWAAPVFIVTYAIVCLTGPITPFPVIAGVLFGIVKGTLWSLSAEALGSSMAFFIGRYFGNRFLERRMGSHYKRLEATIKKEGFRTLLIMRLVGLPPFTIVNYLAGMSGISWGSYITASMLGIFPWTLLMAYFSQLLWTTLVAEGWEGFNRAVMSHWRQFAIAGVLLTLLVLLHWFWKRREKVDDQRAGLKE